MTRNGSIDGLNRLLADYQVLYQKLRAYHWNVRGPAFFALHAHFEELYTGVALKVDAVAERVAALGGRPLSTLAEHLSTARLTEDSGKPAAQDMVRNLVGDYETLDGALRETSAQASESGDFATANLLEGFADDQEQKTWMLRAFLAG